MVTQAVHDALARPKRGIRASWTGQLRIDLLSFPVIAFNVLARDEREIRFHQLHDACFSRIRTQKVCPIHGPVRDEEIVMGYEYSRDKYVEFSPDELDRLRNDTDRDKALEIDAFIAADRLDPIYLDGRAYYLAPAGAEAHEPYAVLCQAMEHTHRVGIGTVVFAQRQQVALLRPLHGLMVMAMLRHRNEVRMPADLELEIHGPKGMERKLELAEQLVQAATEAELDLSRYADRYHQRMASIIQAKIDSREPPPPKPIEEKPAPLSLMEALKRSLDRQRRTVPIQASAGHTRTVRAPRVAHRRSPKQSPASAKPRSTQEASGSDPSAGQPAPGK